MAERNPPSETVKIEQSVGKKPPAADPAAGREVGGSSGPEPTRYGDWEHNGRCSDF